MLPTIQHLDLRSKRVFVRVDLNVPLSKDLKVTNAKRIEAALPTIQYIMEQGGRCILATHLGRPKGKTVPEMSLEPVGAKLSELLGKDVILTSSCIGDGPRSLSQQMRDGEVLLLENLRFMEGETKNSPDFCAKLAKLCDIYINDAFGTCHRAHASTEGLPKMMDPEMRGIGLLIQRELQFLEPLRNAPKRPFALVMGGSKVTDKIGVIDSLLDKVDNILIGGAMAYAFLKAQGNEIGNSLCSDDQVKIAEKVIKSAKARDIHLGLPVDHGITTNFEDRNVEYTDGADVPIGKMAIDIGPKTLEAYSQAVEGAETIFWNGPMGVFEVPEFAIGTTELAKKIASTNALKMAGGGDVVAAIAKSGTEEQFDFMSTGGGATLEFLEGRILPGLKVLEPPKRSTMDEGEDYA